MSLAYLCRILLVNTIRSATLATLKALDAQIGNQSIILDNE